MSFSSSNLRPIFMWLLPLSFFAYQFILRLWPSLLMPQIMTHFAIDATAFGVMSAMYYYGYAGMQIPIALSLDRYNPRYVIFSGIMLCGLATILFTSTDNWYLAMVSRFVVGIGSAVGFLGTSKVISLWFPASQYARLVGFSFSFGLLGAIYGGRPVNMLIESFGGQYVAYVLALFALGLAIMVLLFLRTPKSDQAQVNKFSWHDFQILLRSKTLWLVAIANLLMVGSLYGFADVWGVNYLVTAYQFTKSDAASAISFIFVGMLFGGPVLAIFSEKFGNYKVIAFSGASMAGIFYFMIFFSSYQSWYSVSCLLFVVGIMCCYQVLVFASAPQLVTANLIGVTIAFLNCINMLGGSFFHTVIGLLMDFFWDGSMSGTNKLYMTNVYQYALLAIPVCASLGALAIFCLSLNKPIQDKNSA